MVRCWALPDFTAWLPARPAASAPPCRHDASAGPSPIPIEPTCLRKPRRLYMRLLCGVTRNKLAERNVHHYSHPVAQPTSALRKVQTTEAAMSHVFTHPLPSYVA